MFLPQKYAYLFIPYSTYQEALKMQYTVQAVGLTNEGGHHLLLLHKQVHDERHCRVMTYEPFFKGDVVH